MDRETLVTMLPALLVVAKVTVVLLLAFALTALMQRTSATARHLVWLASLLAMLAIPALSAWSPVHLPLLPASWNVVTASPRTNAAAAPSADRARSHATEMVEPAGTRAPAQTLPADDAPSLLSLVSVPDMLVGTWAVVALALLGWLAHGQWSVRRILARSTTVTDDAWQGSAMEIADRLGLDTLPRLVRGDVSMPFACGVRSPVIVLPRDSESWSSERRTAVLLHELAHVRRHDIVAHTLGRVVSALYWFHPLAWTAARRLRAESERACDDLALACGTRASDYAEHLLEIVTSVRHHGTPNVAMAMATRSEFEGRMLAILDPTLSRTAPTRAQASTLAGGVMMCAIVAGSVVPRAAAPLPPGDTTKMAQRAVMADSMAHATAGRELRAMDTIRPPLRTVLGQADVRLAGARAAGWFDEHGSWHEAKEQRDATGDVDGDPDTRAPARTDADSSARAATLMRILRSDTSASLRRVAAWGLHEFADERATTDVLLAAARSDASASVREMAAWALSETSDGDRVGPALAAALRSEESRTVRETMVWSLAELADHDAPEVLAALRAALGDQAASVRELAAWGIGNASPRRAPAELVAALGDRFAPVRETAAWALFQIEDGSAAAALTSALDRESDPEVKRAMVRALASMGEPAVAGLQRIIEGGDADLRAIAIRALAGNRNDPWPQPRPRPRPFP